MTYFYNFQSGRFSRLISWIFLLAFTESLRLNLKNAMIFTGFDFRQDSAIVSKPAAQKKLRRFPVRAFHRISRRKPGA